MELDRFKTYAAIDFMSAVIPKDSKTGKNCLFVRVEDDKLILTAGGELSYKKCSLGAVNTTSKKEALPEKFMIPRPSLLAFKELMKEHKSECKRKGKNDQGYLIVEITNKTLISNGSNVDYEQPDFQFKELEDKFQVKREPVSSLAMVKGEIESVMKGFASGNIATSLCGEGGPVHFEQGDFEAIMFPPAEKKEGDEQTSFGDNTEPED